VEKINYLLRRFNNTEWSGPAWYRIVKSSDRGFPLEVTLEHFTPIDLGSHTETEMDGEKLGEILPATYKKHPKLLKCHLGLIHSHHTMGAFFSGTDEKALLEQAPEQGLFFSTVVASAKDPFVTAVSYRDQFGLPNYIEGDVKSMFRNKSDKLWRQEADLIEENKKKEVTTTYGGYSGGFRGYTHGGYYGQHNMFGGMDKVESDKTTTRYIKGKDIEDIPDIEDAVTKAYNDSFEPDMQDKLAELYNKLESNELTEADFGEEVRKLSPDLDPHLYVDQLSTTK